MKCDYIFGYTIYSQANELSFLTSGVHERFLTIRNPGRLIGSCELQGRFRGLLEKNSKNNEHISRSSVETVL